MNTNTLLIIGAIAAGMYLLSKRQQAKAAPGAPALPTTSGTGGPVYDRDLPEANTGPSNLTMGGYNYGGY